MISSHYLYTRISNKHTAYLRAWTAMSYEFSFTLFCNIQCKYSAICVDSWVKNGTGQVELTLGGEEVLCPPEAQQSTW